MSPSGQGRVHEFFPPHLPYGFHGGLWYGSVCSHGACVYLYACALSPLVFGFTPPFPLISQSLIHTDFDEFVMESNSFAELRRAAFQDGCNIPARTVANLSMDDARCKKRQARKSEGTESGRKEACTHMMPCPRCSILMPTPCSITSGSDNASTLASSPHALAARSGEGKRPLLEGD